MIFRSDRSPFEDLIVELNGIGRVGETELELGEVLHDIQRSVRRWWKDRLMPWFTDHGPDHSERTAAIALRLADFRVPGATPLSPEERFVLCAAALVHDIGMQLLFDETGVRSVVDLTREDYERIRHQHPQKAREHLLSGTNALEFGLPADPLLAEAIAYVAEAHGTKAYQHAVDHLSTRTRIGWTDIRGPLLGALLLMADELDLDYRRARSTIRKQARLPADSIAHHVKHECIAGVDAHHEVTTGSIHTAVHFRFPSSTPEEDRMEVVRWVRDKLRRQMGLVEREFFTYLGDRVRFDRRVRLDIRDDDQLASEMISEIMPAVVAENRRERVIDYGPVMRTILSEPLPRLLLLLGTRLVDAAQHEAKLSQHQTGREDILAQTFQ